MSIVQIPYFPVGSITRAIVLATFVCNHKYDFTIATSIFGLLEKQRLGTQPKSMLNHSVAPSTESNNDWKKKLASDR